MKTKNLRSTWQKPLEDVVTEMASAQELEQLRMEKIVFS